jgi:hypothetical protein
MAKEPVIYTANSVYLEQMDSAFYANEELAITEQD